MNQKRFANMLRGATSPFEQLNRLRTGASPRELSALMAAALSSRHLAGQLFEPPFPSNCRFSGEPGLSVLDLRRELIWAGEYLKRFGSELTLFQRCRMAFHRSVLTDNYGVANEALNLLNAELGVSLWWIKAKIALLQLSQGLQEQKRFLAQVLEEAPEGGLVRFVAYHASVRNEPAVSPPRFRADFESLLSKFSLTPGFVARLRYHLLPDQLAPIDTLPALLAREAATTVPDYYEATIYALLRVAASEHIETEALRTIEQLVQDVDDPRLLTIASALADDAGILHRDQAIDDGTEALLEGNYDRAIASFLSLLSVDPDEGDALFGLARSLASGGTLPGAEKPLAINLSAHIGRLFTGIKEQQNEPLKYAINFYGSRASLAILALQGTDQGLSNVPDRYVAAPAAVLSSSRLPIWAQLLPAGSLRTAYCSMAVSVSGSPLGRILAAVIATPDKAESLAENERNLVYAQTAYEQANYEASLAHARALLHAPSPFHKRRGARRECLALLGLSRMSEAVNRVATHYLSQPEFLDVLPLAEIVAKNKQARRGSLFESPAWAICLDLHRQFIDHRTDPMFAVVRFLDSAGAIKPSDLRDKIERFERTQLVYFLRFLCVESLMDRSARYDSSKEVLEERLAVCRLLLQIDSQNQETYHAEIKDIARRLMLRRRLREVEKSKIYVDVQSVKRTLEREDADLFARYEALRPRGRDAARVGMYEDLVRRIQSATPEHRVTLMVPPDEAFDVFAGLLARIRDEYVFSSEHGLNKYLSVRIRHGTLTAHLRKPLESNLLVTPRLSGSTGYKPNRHWVSSSTEHVENVAVVERLARFSSDIDKLLDRIKTWLGVSSVPSGDALFKFELKPAQIRDIYRDALEGDWAFETLTERTLDVLNRTLEINLGQVRAALVEDARPSATRLLDELRQDLEGEAGPDLQAAIRSARIELSVAFQRVSEWFRRSSSVASDPFSLEDLVAVGIECAKVLAPKFDVRVSYHPSPDVMLAGSQLSALVDVLFIVFENIVHHSGVEVPSADVSVVLRGADLHVRVENPVASNVESKEALARLERIRAELEEGRGSKAVTDEGGTGFHKLTRVLQHELGVPPALKFGFTRKASFLVDFTTFAKVAES